MTPDLLDEVAGTEGGGPLYRKALEQMGADGWLGIGWPKEVGGQARSTIDQYVFFDEVQRAGFPIPFLTLCTVGPTLMKYGTDEQKATLLPRDPARQVPLRDRLLRAERGDRSRIAADARRARRRSLRRQRAESVHQPRRVRRLHLARRPHRRRRPAPQGDLDPHGGHEGGGLLALADLHARRQSYERDLLRQRPRPRRRCSSGARTTAGSSSRPSSTTSASRSWRPGRSRASSRK